MILQPFTELNNEKTLSLATALTLSLGMTAAAQAAFLNGSLSFNGFFDSIPGSIVNDANLFTFSAVPVAGNGSNNFAGIGGLVDSYGPLDLGNPSGIIFSVGGYSFELTSVDNILRNPLSCS